MPRDMVRNNPGYRNNQRMIRAAAEYAFRNRAPLSRAARRAFDRVRNAWRGRPLPDVPRAPRTKPPKYTNVVNEQNQRSSMVITGSKNIRGIRGKQHKVKVSKSLREKIGKVIESKKLYGVYKTTRHVNIGVIRTSTFNNSYLTDTIGAYTGARLVGRTGNGTQLGNCRWWFAAGVVNSLLLPGDDFNLFTPMKFMDAAAILWNNKVIARDYTLVAGNFVVPTTTLTGVPVTVTEAAPNPQGFELHIINSYVKFEIRNTCQRSMRITCYNMVLKLKHSERLPLDTLIDGIGVHTESTTVKNLFRGVDNTQPVDTLLNDPEFPIGLCPPVSSSYKWEKHEMILSPGETCVHYVQGPKNMDLDFTKLYADAEDNGGRLYKNTSCSVLFSVRPDLVFATAGLGIALGQGPGRFIPPDTPNDILSDPVAIEMVETFKLSIPEMAGFYAQTFVAGLTKTLNLRRQQYAFGNFTHQEDETNMTYVRMDEENPADEMAESQIT